MRNIVIVRNVFTNDSLKSLISKSITIMDIDEKQLANVTICYNDSLYRIGKIPINVVQEIIKNLKSDEFMILD